MPFINNPTGEGHWCDAAKQWLPPHTSISVTSAQQAAQTTAVFTTGSSATHEVVATHVSDGSPNDVERTHH